MKNIISSLTLSLVYLQSIGWAEPGGDENKLQHTLPIPSQAQLDVIAAELPQKPVGVGRPITDRAAWDEAAKHPFFQKQLKDAAVYATQPVPELTDELFNSMLKTGRRDTYERPFQERSARLSAFVVAECIQNQGVYLPLIETELQAILDEKTWAVPNNLIQNRPANQLPSDLLSDKNCVSLIDLAPTARAWTVATVDYWLGDKLNPQTRARIRSEEKRRIFDYYKASVLSCKPLGWMVKDNNVNMVCTSGVVGAALSLIDSPKERALFVLGALNSIPYFINGYSKDGYCIEGISYWNYGFGNYLCLSEMLYQQTQGKLNLYKGDKERQMALYMQHLEITPGVYPAFGDCSPNIHEAPIALLNLINQRWGMGWTNLRPELSDMNASHPLGDRLFCFGVYGFPLPAYGNTMVAGSPVSDSDKASDDLRFFFKDVGVLVSRSIHPEKPPFGIAIKGGDNAAFHGHDDNGSYVVAYNGVPLILDPGREDYNIKTFGPQRHESMMMNSFGHDVPYVGKTLQKGGAGSKGEIVSTSFTEDKDILVMDLTTGYPVPGMVKLTRTFIFDRKRPSLEVVDKGEFRQPTDFGSALVTIGNWKENGPGSFLIYKNKSALKVAVTVEGNGLAINNKIEPITTFLMPKGLKPVRLGVNVNKPTTSVVMHTLIEPAEINDLQAGH